MSSKLAVLPDLAGLRATNGHSLAEIARDTRITLRYLQAIERGDFGKLPGGVYNISYIRQYARAAGCDAEVILDAYRKAAAGRVS